MFPQRRPVPWPFSAALLLLGSLLMALSVALVRLNFDAFVSHGPLHDREPARGEMVLYCLHVALGFPAALCFGRGLDGLLGALRAQVRFPLSPRAHLWCASGVAVLGAWAIGFWVTDFAWFTDDEQAYLYQAKVYGRGALSGPVMEPIHALRHPFVVPIAPRDGVAQWTGVYPVLQPLLMAMSAKLGFIHWSQLVCVGVVVFQTGRLARDLFEDESLGVVASWLCAFSPMLLGLGATYHTSVLATALSVCAVRVLVHLLQHWTLAVGTGLGLITGSIFLARPMEGTLCALLFGGVVLVCWYQRGGRDGSRIRRWLPVLGYASGGLVSLGVFLLVNVAHTGRPMYSAYNILEQYIGGFFGFGDGKMWGRTHTVELAVRQTLGALVRMNAWTFGWPASLALWFFALKRPFRRPQTALLFALSVVQLCAYMPLAFGSVHDFGSAYHVWHLPWLACISAFVLRGFDTAAASWSGRWRNWPVYATSVGMTIAGLLGFWPLQLQRWKAVSDVILDPVRAAEAATRGTKAVVLWSQYLPPIPLRSWVHYPPSPDPADPIIWARYDPLLLGELRSRYPERQFYGLSWNEATPVVVPMQAAVDEFLGAPASSPQPSAQPSPTAAK